MSKLTGRSKKDIFFPSTGLEKDRNNKPVKKLTGENTSEIKKDESGKDYSLIRETTENFIKGDTIKPGSLPRVDNFIQGGDYKVSETPESTTRATDEPRTFSPVRLENKYSSMKSMGQAVAKWTSPLAQKGDAGKTPYVKPKSITEFSKDHGSGKKDAQGNFEYVTTYDRYNFPTKKKNPNYLSKPQPGSNPQAAANTDLFKVKNSKKELPIGIRKPEDVPESSKKPTPTSTVKPKTKVKPKAELLEKVEKRPSTIGQDRERIDNERMRQTIASANDSEKLMAGLSRKERRKMARYDRKKERGLTPEKAVKATEITQTLGSFLKDIGKPDSTVEKAGVTNPVDTEDTTTDTDINNPNDVTEEETSWITGLKKT
jgi:hypothetical protein